MRKLRFALLLVGMVSLLFAGSNAGADGGRYAGEVIADAAVILALPFNDSGDTADLVDDYDEACPDSSDSPDGVYTYRNPTDTEQLLTVDLCNSMYDTKVYIYANAEPGLELLGCNDDAPCGNLRSVTSRLENVPIPPFMRVYIIVDGSNGESGLYGIVVDVDLGACCFADGTCQTLNEADCQFEGGVWQGAGVSCDPNPCLPPAGACCFRSGRCFVLAPDRCATLRGSYQGDGSDCDPNPCPSPWDLLHLGDGSDEGPQTEETETATWGQVKRRYR